MSEQKTKYTPGPWTLNIGCGSKGYAGNYEIIEALTEEHSANAKLIAAAPALLAACKAALRHADVQGDGDCDCHLCNQLRDAIAQAEGADQ